MLAWKEIPGVRKNGCAKSEKNLTQVTSSLATSRDLFPFSDKLID